MKLQKTPKNFLMCISCLFKEMVQFKNDEALIYSVGFMEKFPSIKLPSGGMEQRDFLKITAVTSTQEVKVQYREKTFLCLSEE